MRDLFAVSTFFLCDTQSGVFLYPIACHIVVIFYLPCAWALFFCASVGSFADTQASLAGTGEDGTLSGQDGGTNDGQAVLPTTPLTPTSSNNLGFVLGANLPAIPASLMARIKKGEFVELGELLPEAIGEAFLLQQSGKNSQKTPMINKLVDWLLAYSCYASVLVDAEGHLAPQMLLYQASVVCLAWDYPGKAWLACDRAFRQKMAASKSSNWGTMDHDLWAMAIGSQNSLLIQRCLPSLVRPGGTFCPATHLIGVGVIGHTVCTLMCVLHVVVQGIRRPHAHYLLHHCHMVGKAVIQHVHFLIDCKFYHNLRFPFMQLATSINPYFNYLCSIDKFTFLMCNPNLSIINQTAYFMYMAMQLRFSHLSPPA